MAILIAELSSGFILLHHKVDCIFCEAGLLCLERMMLMLLVMFILWIRWEGASASLCGLPLLCEIQLVPFTSSSLVFLSTVGGVYVG